MMLGNRVDLLHCCSGGGSYRGYFLLSDSPHHILIREDASHLRVNQ